MFLLSLECDTYVLWQKLEKSWGFSRKLLQVPNCVHPQSIFHWKHPSITLTDVSQGLPCPMWTKSFKISEYVLHVLPAPIIEVDGTTCWLRISLSSKRAIHFYDYFKECTSSCAQLQFLGRLIRQFEAALHQFTTKTSACQGLSFFGNAAWSSLVPSMWKPCHLGPESQSCEHR